MDILMIVAVTIAYMVKGICGFGNTLIFSTMLGFRENNIAITPIEAIVGYPSNFIIVWKERKALSAKVWLPLSGLAIAGSVPGAFFLKVGDASIIKTIFGFVIICIGIEMLLREKQHKNRKSSPLTLGVIGIVSGLLSGLFGIGALLTAYVSRTTDGSSSFRGNLCMVFIIENTFRLLLYISTGIITLPVLKVAIMLLPFMLIGLMVGIVSSRFLNDKLVKKVVVMMLVFSGIMLTMNSIS